MKIFTAEQIRQCDEFTIKHGGISSLELMERAATIVTEWLISNRSFQRCIIFCGSGNNGGDGFAVARLLYQQGYDVDVFTDENFEFSPDAAKNFERIKSVSGIDIFSFDELNVYHFATDNLILDALFGTGLNRPISGKVAEVISFLNTLEIPKVSIDIPSGLYADKNLENDSVVFKADDTLSFQFWKKSFLHPGTGSYCGNVHILDIGLSAEYIDKTFTKQFTVDSSVARKIYRPRDQFSHKGNFGKSAIVAGSYGKIGAAVLAVQAALRTGSGITFAVSPICGYEILQISCPEAMFIESGEKYANIFEIPDDAVCGIGPGLGTDEQTRNSLLSFLSSQKKSLVLDADALNIIASDPENLHLIPEGSVLTPHVKEFARLFGFGQNSFERLEIAQKSAKIHNIVIVLKGHYTQIVTSNSVYYNLTGNPGMAKGGSGDVLTGIITSLLAQNYSSEEAAILGVWLHGKAGDLAAEKHSQEAMLASDLIAELGNAFQRLK